MIVLCLLMLDYMTQWYRRIKMIIRSLSLLTLLSTTILYGCSLLSKNNRDDLPIAELDKEPHVFALKNTIDPSYSGSLENFRAYLNDDENTLYRGDVLRRLAALELEESETTIEQAREESEQSLRRSIEHYTAYLKLYPDNKDNDYVLYQLAKAYEFVGDTDNTLLTLEKIIQRYPQTEYIDEIQFRRGEILFVFNDYSNAELAYAEIINNTTSSQYLEKARYKLAWSQFRQAKYMDSLESGIALLDRMHAQGKLADTSVVKGLARSENDFINDVLRVMSLSFSYQKGTKTIQALLADKQNTPYEPLLYWQLSQLYSKTERTLDAANVYLDYVRLHPHTLQSAEFQIMAIKMFTQAGLTELLLTTKEEFVKNFGVGTRFWKNYDADVRQSVRAELKINIDDLAKYYHAIALKTGRSEDYIVTSFWYEEYIRSFPEDSSTPMMNFLLAESQYDAGQYHKALTEYLKTSYDYKPHSKSAESGYAAILTYRLLIDKASKQDKAELEVAALNNAMQFSLKFKDSSYAPAVISTAAEKLYKNKDYKGVVEFAAKNSHLKNLDDQSYFKMTWLVYAHSLFELEDFASAEQAYSATRDVIAKSDVLYQDVSEKLAASIYIQAQMYRDLKYYKLSVYHFLRIGVLVPKSRIVATAQYDAATALILLKSWTEATRILEDFRKDFPENKKYTQGISEKLVLTYTETGQLEKAATEALYLSKISTDADEQRNYLWLAAESYKKSGVEEKANEIYIDYVKKYPEPFVQNIEAHQMIIDYFKNTEELPLLTKWQALTVAAEKRGKNNRTDRTKFIAANAALQLANPLVAEFKQLELIEPLQKNLRAKKKLMEKVLKSFSALMTYEIADITTESTYHVADIYGHFATALLKSQRPENLNEEELEQYEILLEEQAYPFEEKSIEIHLANAKRTSSELYDEWVKKSIAALALLQPIRYAKTERIESYVAKSY